MNNIYGPDECKDDKSKTSDLSEYAKKTYVDTQVDTRLNKGGDNMNGQLNMGGNLIRGLPTTFPTDDYVGDEVVSWRQAVSLTNNLLGNRPTTEQMNNAIRNYATIDQMNIAIQSIDFTSYPLILNMLASIARIKNVIENYPTTTQMNNAIQEATTRFLMIVIQLIMESNVSRNVVHIFKEIIPSQFERVAKYTGPLNRDNRFLLWDWGHSNYRNLLHSKITRIVINTDPQYPIMACALVNNLYVPSGNDRFPDFDNDLLVDTIRERHVEYPVTKELTTPIELLIGDILKIELLTRHDRYDNDYINISLTIHFEQIPDNN